MALDYDFTPLLDKLNNMEKRVASQKTKEVLTASAKPILETQKDIVPKGETKNLRDSLDIGKFKVKKGQTTLQIGIVHDKDRSLVYGYYQEYGTRRMIGKHWISESWKQGHKQAKEVMVVELKKVLKVK